MTVHSFHETLDAIRSCDERVSIEKLRELIYELGKRVQTETQAQEALACMKERDPLLSRLSPLDRAMVTGACNRIITHRACGGWYDY